MKSKKITLKAYYYHCESDSFFIDKLQIWDNGWEIVKIGLCINPSTRDFRNKVKKRYPHLSVTADFYIYNKKIERLIDETPF